MSTKVNWPDSYVFPYRGIPQLFRQGESHELDTCLQTAARVNNLVAMQHCLRSGAMANAKNGEGMTPLQEAFHFGKPLMNLETLNRQTRTELNFLLRKCKILIDSYAHLEKSDLVKLQGFLHSIGARHPESLHSFLNPRPPIGDIEYFTGFMFESLTQSTQGLDQKQGVLFNIADEGIDAYYGAMSKMFHPIMNPFYAEIAKHFTVMRARVDTPNDLPRILDYIANIPEAPPVNHYIFDGHSRRNLIAFGENNVVTSENIPFMQDICHRLPPDANIYIAGCSVAKKEKDNFCWALSRHSDDRNVHGSEGLTTAISAKIFHNNGPKLALFFDTNLGPPHVKIYNSGQLLVRGELTGDDVPDEVMGAIVARVIRPTESKESTEDFVPNPVVICDAAAKSGATKTERATHRWFRSNWNPAIFASSRF